MGLLCSQAQEIRREIEDRWWQVVEEREHHINVSLALNTSEASKGRNIRTEITVKEYT